MIVVERINSRRLAGNLIGDPSERDLVVYLPPGYRTSARRYATAYLLHGFGGKALEWTNAMDMDGWLMQPIDQVFDPVMAGRQAEEMIVVMPDGWSAYGCSQWVDSPVNGRFEQYVTQEIVPYIDARFRTIPSRDSRGVFGISSGGFGAWQFGTRHPDLFGAMALLSADSYFDLTHKPWLYKFYDSIYPGEPNGPIAGNSYAELCYGLAACYTPNVDNPPYYVDLPVRFPSGEIIQPLWERWLSYDPVVNWSQRTQQLRRLRGILLDAGYHDEYELHYGHRLLSLGLASAGIAHHVEEHEGTHVGRLHERLQLALAWLSETLEHH